jgi:hypothetical protein
MYVMMTKRRNKKGKRHHFVIFAKSDVPGEGDSSRIRDRTIFGIYNGVEPKSLLNTVGDSVVIGIVTE